MARRQTYRPGEIRAGQTFFISFIDRMPRVPVPVVREYLATSRRGHWPVEGEIYPYRMRPELIAHIAEHCTLYRTRRAATRALAPALAGLRDISH
jgi:hypothetical protein